MLVTTLTMGANTDVLWIGAALIAGAGARRLLDRKAKRDRSARGALTHGLSQGNASHDADQHTSQAIQQQLAELEFSLVAARHHNTTLRQERRATLEEWETRQEEAQAAKEEHGLMAQQLDTVRAEAARKEEAMDVIKAELLDSQGYVIQLTEERLAEQEKWRREMRALQQRFDCSVKAEREVQHLNSRIQSLSAELTTQAEAARRVQLQVNDLQEQLRTQESATDEAVEARRKGEACVEVMSKTFREPDALVASAKAELAGQEAERQQAVVEVESRLQQQTSQAAQACSAMTLLQEDLEAHTSQAQQAVAGLQTQLRQQKELARGAQLTPTPAHAQEENEASMLAHMNMLEQELSAEQELVAKSQGMLLTTEGRAQQLLSRAEIAEGQVGMSQAPVIRLSTEAADSEERLSTQAGQAQELAATRQDLAHTKQQLRALQLTLQVGSGSEGDDSPGADPPALPASLVSSTLMGEGADLQPEAGGGEGNTGATAVEEQEQAVQEEAGIPEDMGQDVVPEAPVNGGPGVNPNFMTCRGEPLRVAQDYTDLCDMGIYDPATNFLPPPTDRDTVSVIIPINTPMHKIALEHPNYGLVSLTNANELMQKLNEYVGEPNDLDKVLGRMAQTVAFMAYQLNWARTAMDPTYHYGDWGKSPLTPREQRSHVKGIIAREGVGQGDNRWQAYLSEMGAVHPNTMEDWEAEDGEDEYVGISKACQKCSRVWDTGRYVDASRSPTGPLTEIVRFVCHKCPANLAEFPLCVECARECFDKNSAKCGHALGKKLRYTPRRAHENASHSIV